MGKSERWQQVEQLYHAAREQPVEYRPTFLAEACSDEALRQEVESLLAYEDRAENFIESPALDVAAKLTAEKQGVTVTAGQSINQYKIIAPIGAGGMGEVYLAEDTRLVRRVALKFLPAHLTQDKRYLRRFEQEARAVAALSHPHVCMIHEIVATEEGRHCIVMEYVEGTTLREHIAKQPMSVNEALDVVIQVASALSAAHGAGVVHRDIKLENIMLRHDGYVKILDFGLAKVSERELAAEPEAATKMLLNTAPGMVMGTVYYMSPEQARGLPVDARTDIWSLGVVLYELISGHQPFTGATPTDVIIALAEREPLPLTRYQPSVPAELERIVKKALAKDRAQRYQNANDLLIDLKNLKRDLVIQTEVQRAIEPTSNNSFATTSEQALITSRVLPFNWTRSRVALVVALLGLLIVGGFVYSRYLRRSPIDNQAPQIKSLAVLPMANLSLDPDQDYFADGMTETLIAGLAKIGALRVISSRASVIQYKGTNKTLPEIARELNVDAIVAGSVQRAGERVKVTVRLISATEQLLWSDSYDRELRDVLTLQNEVARDVTQKIQIKLTPRDQESLGSARRIEPAAYDDFLRGRYYLNHQSEANNKIAIEKFEQAVEKDPQFAAAFAELAQAYVWRLFLFAPDEKELEEKAFVAVGKALAIDQNLAEAHLARGRLLWTPTHQFPHDSVIREYRQALRLNSNLDEAHHQLALVFGHIGLFEEALQELKEATAINPSNALARYRFGEIWLFQGKYEQALTALRNVPSNVNPALVGHQTVWALFNLGRKEEAAVTIEQFLKNYPDDNRGLLTSQQAVLAASAGQEKKAEDLIKLAIQRGKGFGHFHHTAYHIACAYALLNKPEPAIKWLENAARDGFPNYPLFEREPSLNSLRQDPRFLALMTGLKQQWESYKTL